MISGTTRRDTGVAAAANRASNPATFCFERRELRVITNHRAHNGPPTSAKNAAPDKIPATTHVIDQYVANLEHRIADRHAVKGLSP
jgi:hypothetical protein